MSNESNTTTKDQVSCFHAPAEAKTRNSDFYALNPDTLEALRESHESSFIFRNITPSDFTDWEALYPELYEADNTRYEYDGFAERMIVKCMAGPVHDSFCIFFIRAVHDGLDRTGRECRRGLQISATTDFYNFKGAYADTHTRKSPDAYIKVAGSRGFPSIVAEVGWAESMEDLMADARLWLLGTAGQTKVVIIVNFTEDRRGPRTSASSAPSSSATGSDTETSAHDDGEDEGDDTADGDASLDPSEPSEEALLLSTVNATTRFSALAAGILDLHLRGALAKPLLGSITATFHVFRRTPADTVYEEFSTTVLPAPEPGDAEQRQTYALTLGDLYGDNPLPAGEDPHHRFVMDMDDFRRDIAHQVPEMEEKRSLDRAEAVLKKRGFWEGREPFAGAKKAKRKPARDGNADGEYQKRAR